MRALPADQEFKRIGEVLDLHSMGTYSEHMRFVPAMISSSFTPQPLRRCATGIGSLDKAMGGGMARGCVHEFYAAEPEDASAVAGFAVGLALLMAAGGMIIWLRSRRSLTQGGVLQASGWAELGGAPDTCLFGLVEDDKTLLRTAADALRSAALGAVVLESRGVMRGLDLTASRRLALAAEKSGVPLFLLRIDAEPVPSAAQTRWHVIAAPSRALPGHAPGAPAYDIELLRQKAGPSGQNWRLEWDRDRLVFREATLSGAVVSVPAHRPAADAGARNAA